MPDCSNSRRTSSPQNERRCGILLINSKSVSGVAVGPPVSSCDVQSGASSIIYLAVQSCAAPVCILVPRDACAYLGMMMLMQWCWCVCRCICPAAAGWMDGRSRWWTSASPIVSKLKTYPVLGTVPTSAFPTSAFGRASRPVLVSAHTQSHGSQSFGWTIGRRCFLFDIIHFGGNKSSSIAKINNELLTGSGTVKIKVLPKADDWNRPAGPAQSGFFTILLVNCILQESPGIESANVIEVSERSKI